MLCVGLLLHLVSLTCTLSRAPRIYHTGSYLLVGAGLASSFIEEEHRVTYYLTATALLVLLFSRLTYSGRLTGIVRFHLF